MAEIELEFTDFESILHARAEQANTSSEVWGISSRPYCSERKSNRRWNLPTLQIRRNSKSVEIPNLPKLQISRNSKSAETPHPPKLRIRPNSTSADTPNLPKFQMCRSDSPASQTTHQSGGRGFRTDLEGAFEAAHN
jgi:hypothetical protein